MTNPQAESMIESGRPLKEVALIFPTKIAAYQYFANAMARRFASPTSCCAMCNRDCDASPVRIRWRANVHTTKTVFFSFLFTAVALFAAHLYSRWVVVEFTTFHRLCLQCQRGHHSRRLAVNILHKALFATLISLLFLTVPLVIFLFAMPFIAPEGTWLMLTGSLVGVGLIALVMWGFEACRSSVIPPPLRQIGRFPFFLFTLQLNPEPQLP
jgi:hypothetical protein